MTVTVTGEAFENGSARGLDWKKSEPVKLEEKGWAAAILYLVGRRRSEQWAAERGLAEPNKLTNSTC